MPKTKKKSNKGDASDSLARLRARAAELHIPKASTLDRRELSHLIYIYKEQRKRMGMRGQGSLCGPGDSREDLLIRVRLLGFRDRDIGVPIESLDNETLCGLLYSRQRPRYGVALGPFRPSKKPQRYTVGPTDADKLPQLTAIGIKAYSTTELDTAGQAWLGVLLERYARVACPLVVGKKRTPVSIHAEITSDEAGRLIIHLEAAFKYLDADRANELVAQLPACASQGKRFAAMPLEVIGNAGADESTKLEAHAGMLIYDIANKTLERWEPWGKDGLLSHPGFVGPLAGQLTAAMDKAISRLLVPRGWKYVLPQLSCPLGKPVVAEGPQHYEMTIGYCWSWSWMYLEMRLKYPQLNPQQVNAYMTQRVRALGREGAARAINAYFMQIMAHSPPKYTRRRQPKRVAQLKR